MNEIQSEMLKEDAMLWLIAIITPVGILQLSENPIVGFGLITISALLTIFRAALKSKWEDEQNGQA